MAQCEMCGKDTSLVDAIVEGTTLSVCTSCARFGNVLQPAKPQAKSRQKGFDSQFMEQETEMIVDNYSVMVKNAREQRNLKQEDLAKAIAEKESVIHKIESGHMEPTFGIARKLENFFGIRLITKTRVSADKAEPDKKDGSLTIGDFIKVRPK